MIMGAWGTAIFSDEYHFFGRDASYENDLPEFFKVNRMQYALTNLYAFDNRLTVRLKELFGE